MKSDSSKGRITVSGVRDDVLEEFDALADAEDKSRSEKVVELIEREVADGVPNVDGSYLPTDDELRMVYEAALETATMPAHTLRFDRWGGTLAQKSNMGKKAVRGQLFRLESRGYVRHQFGGTSGDTDDECYRIKPRCANPRVWQYSRIRDDDAVRRLDVTGSEEEPDDPETVGDHLDALQTAGEEASQSAD